MEQSIVSPKLVNEENRIKRECKGRALCIQRKVNQFLNSDVFYVESESLVGKYYYVKFVFESSGNFWCSCPDYASNRSEKCKHLYAVEYAIRLNLVQTIDKKLPISSKKSVTDQYKNLSIRDLNELEKAEIEAEQYSRTKRQSWELDDYSF